MAGVTLGGNAITVNGNLPKAGETAPDFSLTGKDLKEVSLDENNKVLHSELVPEIKQEPNYDSALRVLGS